MSKPTTRRLKKDKKRKKENKEKLRRLRVKNKKKKQAKAKKEQPPLPTANARMIKKFLDAGKMKGDFRDYVILTGNRMLDWEGSYELEAPDGGAVQVAETNLMHKKKLETMFESEQGAPSIQVLL